jgi:thiosulfate reductase/polysulfide reductase chain A
LGISNNAMVEISSKQGSGIIKASVTDLIHPESVFMLHGFGHQAKRATRSYNKGVSDSLLEENVSDLVGGSPAFHETFVKVKAA